MYGLLLKSNFTNFNMIHEQNSEASEDLNFLTLVHIHLWKYSNTLTLLYGTPREVTSVGSYFKRLIHLTLIPNNLSL